MIQVSLDTSFLISFADPNRPNHAVAVDYFRHCVTQSIPMWISVVAAGEFQVKQPINDLPLQNFRILPYNLQHAIKSATFFNLLKQGENDPEDSRKIITNDLKILAQAEEEEIPIIMSEDERTMSRIAKRLEQAGLSSVKVLLLADGFTPTRLVNPDQHELPLPPDDQSEG